MGPELVTIIAGGQPWTAFRRVMVRTSFRDAAISFHIDIAAEPTPALTAKVFKAGTPVDILANGDLLCRGYVDRYRPRLNEHDQAEIAVSGRSKSQDAIDSSAMHKTGRFKKKDVAEIARELDQFGVGFKTDQVLDKLNYQITPGESVFRCIEKLCRSQGVWPVGQPDGSVLITVAGNGRHTPLIESRNCKGLEGDHNWSNRHSKVIVRGQRPWGHGADALEIEATAEDAAVGRHRPIVVIQDDDTDKGRAKKRATHRRDSEAGNSLKANVEVQSFRDDAGRLWRPGWLSYTESPFLDIYQDMAIEDATFTQERGKGSVTMLSLVDPRALGSKARKGGGPRKGGKSGEPWKTNAGAE